MKTYILQKKLPDSDIGDKYIYNEKQKAYYKNGDINESYWMPNYVENNIEWFVIEDDDDVDFRGGLSVYIHGERYVKYSEAKSIINNFRKAYKDVKSFYNLA